MKNFGRVITAMITPFMDDGAVDYDGGCCAGQAPD